MTTINDDIKTALDILCYCLHQENSTSKTID